jgi:hypothetical protein
MPASAEVRRLLRAPFLRSRTRALPASAQERTFFAPASFARTPERNCLLPLNTAPFLRLLLSLAHPSAVRFNKNHTLFALTSFARAPVRSYSLPLKSAGSLRSLLTPERSCPLPQTTPSLRSLLSLAHPCHPPREAARFNNTTRSLRLRGGSRFARAGYSCAERGFFICARFTCAPLRSRSYRSRLSHGLGGRGQHGVRHGRRHGGAGQLRRRRCLRGAGAGRSRRVLRVKGGLARGCHAPGLLLSAGDGGELACAARAAPRVDQLTRTGL